MFTGSTKLPPAKTPQPERLDEVYAALRRGLQWVNTFRLCLHYFSLSEWTVLLRLRRYKTTKFKGEGETKLLPLSGRTCRSTSWSWRVWGSRSERTRGTVAWWEPVHPVEALSANAAESVCLLTGCFVMLSVPLFFWQGSLYEQDKVSFSDGCRLAENFRGEVSQCVIMLFSPTAQQVKAIERFMRRLEFHLSKVRDYPWHYCHRPE